MIREHLKNILHFGERKLMNRNFKPVLLNNHAHHHELAEHGFVMLQNVLTSIELEALLQTYREVSEMPGFETPPRFINSLSFLDTEVKRYIQHRTLTILVPVLERMLDINAASFPFGAGYCISPSNSFKGCVPHQDPAYVDESNSYSMSLWIALHDMTPENGCLHFVPGSHLWGNIHRSVSLKWAFDDFENELWKYAEALPIRAGDAVCFDNSVIHFSPINRSRQLRLAVSLPVYPAGQKVYTYFPEKESIFGAFASLYEVDENYFIEESLFDRPTSRYLKVRTFNLRNYYNRIHTKVSA